VRVCVWTFLCVTCRALANVSPGLAIAARMAVVVVPIFEPRDNGYALSMLMTPIPIYFCKWENKLRLCVPEIPLHFVQPVVVEETLSEQCFNVNRVNKKIQKHKEKQNSK